MCKPLVPVVGIGRGMAMMILRSIKQFHTWVELFLLAVCPLAMLVGLIAGTVSLMLGGALAQEKWFQVTWAITQAAALDSFFLVMVQIFFALSWRGWAKYGYGLLILIYACPVYMALNLVAYQDLHASTLSQAMGVMGVDLSTFITMRTCMNILTLAMYYPVLKQTSKLFAVEAPTGLQGRVDRVVEQKQERGQIALPGTNQEQLSHRVTQEASPYPEGQPNNPYPQPDATQDNPSSLQGLTQQPNPSNPQPNLVTQQPNPTTQEDEELTQPDNLTYLRVLNAYRVLNQQGEEVTAAKIVDMAGVGLSSAKKYLRQIRAA